MSDVISGFFEWDSEKDDANRKKRGIAFQHATQLFDGPHMRMRSTHKREERRFA